MNVFERVLKNHEKILATLTYMRKVWVGSTREVPGCKHGKNLKSTRNHCFLPNTFRYRHF